MNRNIAIILLIIILEFCCPVFSFAQDRASGNEAAMTGASDVKTAFEDASANQESDAKNAAANDIQPASNDEDKNSQDNEEVNIVVDDKEKNTLPPELKSSLSSDKADNSATGSASKAVISSPLPSAKAESPADSSEDKVRKLVSNDSDSGYPVSFFNRKITSLRRDITEWPAEFRAKNASANIEKAFRSAKRGSIKAVKIKYGYDIRLGDISLFRILEGDADPSEEISLENYAKAATKNLIEAAREYHKQKSGWVIVNSIIAVIVFLLLSYGFLFLIKIIRKYCDRHCEKWLKRLLEKFASIDFARKHAKNFALSLNRTASFLLYLCFILFFYTGVTLILSYIPYTKPWVTGLLQSIIAIVSAFSSGFIRMLPGIIIFILVLFTTKIAVNLVNIFFDGVANNDISFPGIDKDTIVPTKRISSAFIWLVGIGLAYPFIPGSESDAFKGLSVILGLMVSLGSSNIINQAISGMIIIYSKTLKPGDFVKIKDNEGYVISTGAFNVKLKTPLNEEIIVPNSVFLDSSTVNYSRLKNNSNGVAFTVAVGLDYNVPWRQVNAMLLESARRTTSLKKDVKPYVWQTEMADYYMEYKLVVWIDHPEMKSKIRSELYANIQDVFNEYGVQIMTPRYLTIYKDKIWSPKEEWYMEPADPNENIMETFGFGVNKTGDLGEPHGNPDNEKGEDVRTDVSPDASNVQEKVRKIK